MAALTYSTKVLGENCIRISLFGNKAQRKIPNFKRVLIVTGIEHADNSCDYIAGGDAHGETAGMAVNF